MNKKRLLCIVLSLVAVSALFLVDNSVAWFNTETGTQLSQEVDISKMNFEFLGELGSCYEKDGSEFIVTNQNLIATNNGVISLVNQSTIDTQVRFKIEYPTPSGTVTYSQDSDEDLSVTFASDKAWTYANGYFSADFSAVTGENETFDVITDLSYKDSVDRDSYLNVSGGRVGTPLTGEVTVTFQAKQANHVEWEDIWTVSP